MLTALPAFYAGRARLFASSVLTPAITNHNSNGRAQLSEGRTLLVTLAFPFAVKNLSGSFPVEILTGAGRRFVEEQELFFYPAEDEKTFHTILSAPLDARARKYPVKLVLTKVSGERVEQDVGEYRISRGAFRRSSLNLSKRFSHPSNALRERMRREFETIASVYRRRTPRIWRRSFIRPVFNPDANNFGVKRVVNKTKRYRHAGLDYRSPVGTPVRAMNDGIVALSSTHWTPGELVCIDHGGGIFTRYIHLSRRRVRRGQRVKRGQVIGLSGRSGGQRPRPHLHVDAVVNGTQVSPRSLRRTASRLISIET